MSAESNAYNHRVSEHLKRICKTLYVCGKCGKTSSGADLKVSINPPKNLYDAIPSFGCECGGTLEPLYSANA